ncbi:MAG TPA: hypothetical protein VK841_16365, partial [Polyangiaceae bacterium]|nr:hypothetical protein [Polyangiaceae bacterium]
NFMGPNGHVWELSYDTQWHANDLNVAAGIPSTTAVTGALDGYQTLAPNQRHVDFISAANNHVFELYYDTSWHPRDLTSVPVPTPPVPIGRITGFTTTVVNNQQHVDYVAFGGDVIELVH